MFSDTFLYSLMHIVINMSLCNFYSLKMMVIYTLPNLILYLPPLLIRYIKLAFFYFNLLVKSDLFTMIICHVFR